MCREGLFKKRGFGRKGCDEAIVSGPLWDLDFTRTFLSFIFYFISLFFFFKKNIFITNLTGFKTEVLSAGLYELVVQVA